MSTRDTITKKYMSEPAHFADFFNGYIYNGEEVVKNNMDYQSIDKDTAIMMKELADIKLQKRNKEGEYNMCKAILDLEKKGQEIGEKIGADNARIEAIKNLMETTNKSFEEACSMLKINEEDMERYREML